MKLNPWIITLAMSFVFNGLAIGYSHGYSYEMPRNIDLDRKNQARDFFILFILIVVMIVILYVMFDI